MRRSPGNDAGGGLVVCSCPLPNWSTGVAGLVAPRLSAARLLELPLGRVALGSCWLLPSTKLLLVRLVLMNELITSFPVLEPTANDRATLVRVLVEVGIRPIRMGTRTGAIAILLYLPRVAAALGPKLRVGGQLTPLVVFVGAVQHERLFSGCHARLLSWRV